MSEIFRYIFDYLTDPLGLPIDWYWEYIILLAVEKLAYLLAFDNVGDLYRAHLIDGKITGSFLHWLIRFVYFVVIWAATYLSIQAYYFVSENLQIVLMTLGCIAGTAALCTLTVFVMRFFNKRKMG